MNWTVLFWAFVWLAPLLVLVALAGIGYKKLSDWLKARPIKSALVIAGLLALGVALLYQRQPGLFDCWPAHKLGCLFMADVEQSHIGGDKQ